MRIDHASTLVTSSTSLILGHSPDNNDRVLYRGYTDQEFNISIALVSFQSRALSKAPRDLRLLQTMYEDDYSSAMYTYDDLVLTCHYAKGRCDRSSWTVRVEVP